MKNNMYVTLLDDKYHCLLPGRIYKCIPREELIDKINWMLIYYDVYKGILHGKILDEQVKEWDLEKILDAIDIKI